MHIGVARILVRMPENASLKDKRMVVRSIAQRVRNRFNAAVSEVDTQDDWKLATLGVACVSGDARHADEMLNKIVAFIESERLDADVTATDWELIAV